jgi:hypothetical protein
MTNDFIVVWGREGTRPYSTYTAKDGRPMAFSDGNLWFSDCPTVASLEELDAILSRDPAQQVVVPVEDARALFGWEDFASPETA